jgi:hypothetical protein
MVQSVIHREPHVANAREEFDPWKKQPEKNADAATPPGANEEKACSITGDEKTDGTELAYPSALCRSQSDGKQKDADDYESSAHESLNVESGEKMISTDVTDFLNV